MSRLLPMKLPSFIVIILIIMHYGMLHAMDRIELNASPLKRSRTENLPLVPKVDYRVALDAALKQVDEDGNTVLHIASTEGNVGMVQDLLSRGANPCIQNKQGQTALHSAVSNNHHEIVQQLLQGMPKKAKRERIITFLRVLRQHRMPADLRLTLLSYLPELVTAYPRLCVLLVPNYIAFDQVCSAQITPQLELLNIQDGQGLIAHAIARNNRNGFMARMTNPKNRPEVCKEELTSLLKNPTNIENRENKE